MPSFIPRKGPGGKRVWPAHVRRRGYPAQVRTFDTKAEAEAWAGDFESEIRHGTFVSRTEAETTTLREALCRYQAEIVARKRKRRGCDHSVVGGLAPGPTPHRERSGQGHCGSDQNLGGVRAGRPIASRDGPSPALRDRVFGGNRWGAMAPGRPAARQLVARGRRPTREAL